MKKLNTISDIAYINNKDLPASIQKEIFNEARIAYKDKDENYQPRVLLIGGAGYIGTIVSQYLLDYGYQVRCYDNLIYGQYNNVLPFLNNTNYEFIYGDICNQMELELALKNVDSVVLLAGLVGDPITKTYPDESELINEKGIINTISMLNGKGIRKVVFISTCSNYGLINNDELAAEDYQLNPLSLYAKAKVSTEKYILSLKDNVDYHPTILRFATAFGLSPRMRFDLTISEFVHDLYFGKELLVYDANTWRPYCHVADFALLIRRTLEFPVSYTSFEVFNAGGEINNFTKQGVVDHITKFIPNCAVKYKDHGADPRNYRVNFSKVKKIMHFEPSFSVEDGIQELIFALSNHLFDSVDSNRNDFGNYKLKLST